MLKELQDSVKARLYDFQSTPFLASVIISWILINHKYLMIYFSDYDLEEKIILLDCLYDSYLLKALCFYVLPILFGLFYVFIYPKINKYFYDFTLQKRKELKKIKQKIEDETPLSQKEANELMQTNFTLQDEKDELYRKYNALKQEYEVKLEEDKKGLRNEIDAQTIFHEKLGIELSDLKENINKLSKENEKLKNENNNFKNKLAENIKPSKNSFPNKYNLSDLEIKILKYLYESNFTHMHKSTLEKEISDKLRINIIKAQNLIAELRVKDILGTNASTYIILTTKGQKIVLDLFDN